MLSWWLRKSRQFTKGTNASIAVLFALASFPMLIAIGAAVDISTASSRKTRLQAASDSAVLAGVLAAKAALDRGTPEAAAMAAARTAATSFFQSNFSGGGTNVSTSFSLSGLTISGAVTAQSDSTSQFSGFVGPRSLPVQVTSRTQASVEPYLNIYLLIDISASMLLPATDAGITRMRNEQGCALACHDRTDGNDTFGYALRNNITLRYQVVNQGIANFLAFLNARQTLAGRIRVELWSFDHEMKTLVPLTSDLSRISSNYPAPALAVTRNDATTKFDDLIGTFVNSVGTSGAGTSQLDAKKLIMIATDGVNDPDTNWTTILPLRALVRAFNTAFCDTLKSRGNTVAIVNTPYLPMPWDWGYVATLGLPGQQGGATRVDDIPIALRRCAGKYFTIASDSNAIRSAFIDLYTAAMPVRLSQ